MTEQQVATRIELIIKNAFAEARTLLPRDTGNLQDNAYKLTHIARWTWRIEVQLPVAPYFVFVNETPPYPRSKKEADNKRSWQRVCDYIINRVTEGLQALWRECKALNNTVEFITDTEE